MIGNQLHSGLMSLQNSRPERKSELVLKVTQRLSEWRASLPSYFRSTNVPDWFRCSRAVVSWKEQNLRILLWQAVERTSTSGAPDFGSRLNCGMAALEAVNDITQFGKDHLDLIHPGLSWYAVYFLFQATLVLVFHELQNLGDGASGELEKTESPWLRGINDSRECLERLGQDNNAARRCLIVLNRISAGVSTAGSTNLLSKPESSMAPNDTTTGIFPGAFGDLDVTLQNDASPEAAALFEDYWSAPADPSLNMFLGDAGMQGLFEDFNGFPGTVERNAFHYIDFNMYNTSIFPSEEET